MDTLQHITIDEIWDKIEQELAKNNEPYSEMRGTYEIQITDENVRYQIEFENGEYTIQDQGSKNPDCILKMKGKVFRNFLAGDVNSMTAFMTGKLKVDGNITPALKLESMLKKYQF